MVSKTLIDVINVKGRTDSQDSYFNILQNSALFLHGKTQQLWKTARAIGMVCEAQRAK